MNEAKLKTAFGKIKKDIDSIKKELGNLKELRSLNSDVKNQKNITKYDLEGFVVNMQKDLSELSKLVSEFNTRFKNSDEEINKFSKKLKKYHNELLEVKKNLSTNTNETTNAELDLRVLNERFSEFEELINEKMSLENASLKLELEDEIATISDRVESKQTQSGEGVSENALEIHMREFNELINEKITLEINSMRLEFTEEIGKLYDRFYNEIIDIKTEMGIRPQTSARSPKPTKKNTITKKPLSKKTIAKEEEKTTIDTTQSKNKEKPSKIKKAIKWLFVDEDEEIDSIRSEVKKSSKK